MSNVKYLYVRNEWKKRDITIVSDIFDDEGKTYIRCGWSFRSNHDKFIKKEGRKLALERMSSKDIDYSAILEIDPEDIKFYNIASKVLSVIIEKESTPRKFLDDLYDDLRYFSECSISGRPSWESIFTAVEKNTYVSH
jgi:hypothetical protein